MGGDLQSSMYAVNWDPNPAEKRGTHTFVYTYSPWDHAQSGAGIFKAIDLRNSHSKSESGQTTWWSYSIRL